MPETRIVEARINANVNPATVELKGEAGLPPRQTFRVQGGDVVVWKLQDANGATAAFETRVTFADLGPASLFANELVFKAQGGQTEIKTEGVNSLAAPRDPIDSNTPPVAYSYKFELKGPGGAFMPLACLWGGQPTDMGGGEKGPRPIKT